ncbi:MAG: preprotein translocase subunit YajC [Gemmataceae bacterium]
MFELLMLFAEGETKQGQPLTFEPLLFMLAIFALFYFIVIRPQQRRQDRDRQDLVSNLKKNDRVITSAGIYGTIVSVSDKEDEVTVKVDDNARLKMLKSSILRNLTADEAKKADADKAKETK